MEQIEHEYAVFDVETTTQHKGTSFYRKNKLVLGGTVDNGGSWNIFGDGVRDCDPVNCRLLITFNGKFDLHWANRLNLPIVFRSLWDCQLVHYLLQRQRVTYPSLNDVLGYYGLPPKYDYIAELWDNGVNTDEISLDLLAEYMCGDIEKTEQVYLLQRDEVASRGEQFRRLVSLDHQDLLVCIEMERNGILYDLERSLELGHEYSFKIEEIDKELRDILQFPEFKPSSNDHKSACIYGGICKYKAKTMKHSVLKSGEQRQRVVNGEMYRELPSMIQLSDEEKRKLANAKEGYYSTDEDTLKTLLPKASKQLKVILKLFLERAKLAKFVSTYCLGFPKKIKEMEWEDNIIHSQFNQPVTETGRLSSSKPNVQNIDGKIKECIITRF